MALRHVFVCMSKLICGFVHALLKIAHFSRIFSFPIAKKAKIR